MKIIVCGARDWTDYPLILFTLRSIHSATPITLVIEGEAKGADKLGRQAAEFLGIPVEPHPADWEHYGRAAGPIRNREMLASNPELVLAFHPDLDYSKGTRDMIRQATKAGVPVKVVTG